MRWHNSDGPNGRGGTPRTGVPVIGFTRASAYEESGTPRSDRSTPHVTGVVIRVGGARRRQRTA